MTLLLRGIDVETTGLDPALHKVVEIATVDVIVGGDGKIERGAMWSSLINPERNIPPESSAIHDITDEMVKDAPTLFDVIGHVVGPPDPDYYFAHNSRYDSKFFDQTVLRRPWLDTYRIALWLWPSAPDHKLATLRYWLNLKLSINEQMQVDGNPGQGSGAWIRSHRALWDAYVCAAVLRRAFMTGATIEQMVEVSSQPALLPRLTFGEHAMKPIEQVPSSYLQWILDKFEASKADERHTALSELQRRRNLATLQG